ncbi:hypothetical protein O0I10_006282 [Lichtheimia ornata]|uniref:Uncharacterized protein n=1 Tax=Lichtheimia ornata TaxID=688661 RepID=A0AAD7XYY3_9FUNG|nr:uncharacterized protein O0I10_006282 [Lichtheimia ornata]KAJ8658011.1 hypothetical protein O0I10_006282 [Lichtheimia ornata]
MGITSLPMTTWSKLTTLMISNAREMITRDEVNAIGKRFPSLTKLQLYPWQDPESTRMVFDCYPWMNSIDIVKISSAFNIAYYQHKPRRTGNGVTNIDIRVYSMKDDDWKYLIHILREHSLTLEWMYVYVVVVNVHEEVHNIKYPCLKHLILDHSGWWIPRNAPMLEDLEIQQLSYCLEVRVVPDTASPKLKRLQVHRDCPTHTGDTPPLERYLHQLAQHAQLQDLDVTLYSLERIDHILDAMLHLGSLVRLMMFVTSDWGSTSMHRFLAGLSKGCPKLSSLGISCHNAPSACSMNALKQLLHLERFGFSIEGMDSDDAFWHAIETFPQLKSIYIFPSNETNIRRLRYLKEKRPDLKITISRRLNDI